MKLPLIIIVPIIVVIWILISHIKKKEKIDFFNFTFDLLLFPWISFVSIFLIGMFFIAIFPNYPKIKENSTIVLKSLDESSTFSYGIFDDSMLVFLNEKNEISMYSKQTKIIYSDDEVASASAIEYVTDNFIFELILGDRNQIVNNSESNEIIITLPRNSKISKNENLKNIFLGKQE